MASSGKMLVCLLLIGSYLSAAVKVQVNAKKIGKEDALRVTIPIKNSQTRPSIHTADFTEAGISQSSSIQVINGQVNHTVNYTFNLRPAKTGTCRFIVKIGTNQQGPYDIEVVAGSLKPKTTQPAPPRNPFDEFFGSAQPPQQQQIGDRDILFRNELSRSSCYVGETVVMHIVLYHRVGLAGINMKKENEMEGISSEVSDKIDRNRTTVKLQGVPYHRQNIARYILTPVMSGKRKIKGGVISAQLPGSFFTRGPVKDIKIPDVTLGVKPPPTAGRPASWNNAVGDFKLSMRPSAREVKAHEPVIVKLVITGTGNFRTLSLPELKTDHKDLMINKSKYRENYDLKGSAYSGSKSIEYYLIPRKQGSFKIPDMKFSYFSPAKGAYRTATASGFTLKATKPDKEELTIIRGTGGSELEYLSEDIRYIKQGRMRSQSSRFFSHPVFILSHLLALILAGGGAFIFFRRIDRKLNYGSYRRSGAFGAARKGLKQAAKAGSNKDFFKAVERCLQEYITARFNLSHGLSLAGIRRTLAEVKTARRSIDSLLALIKTCQDHLYAPSYKKVDREDFMGKAVQMVEDVENGTTLND